MVEKVCCRCKREYSQRQRHLGESRVMSGHVSREEGERKEELLTKRLPKRLV